VTWRPLTLAERQLTFIWSGLILAMIALRPLWIVLAPYLRPCGLREVTGIPCPTCGTTRSGLALLEGRLADALLYNPLFTIAAVAGHGGWVELVGVEGDAAIIQFGGGCQGCGMAQVTLKEGIETAILQEVPEIKRVLDDTDHDSGSNPYYSG
jgi:Fe-S cluster biogenesis protein NfuA